MEARIIGAESLTRGESKHDSTEKKIGGVSGRIRSTRRRDAFFPSNDDDEVTMRFCWGAATAALIVALLPACGGGSDTPSSSNGGGGNDAGGGGSGPGGGPVGGGGSAPLTKPEAGIDGCAKVFIDADGVCRPSLDKCAKGTIPQFEKGCVPVGISKCDAKFKDSTDGLCHPTMAKCAADEFAVPSEGCVKIDGAGCGTDTFGLVTAQASDQYVDGSFTGGASDGSRTAPWTTIADALAHAAANGRVVLAAGNYAEPMIPTQGVTVVGRCASMVTVSGTTTGVDGPLIIKVEGVTGKVAIQNLTLKGDGYGILTSSVDISFDGVVVDSTLAEGLVFGAATKADIHHVLVKDTRVGADGLLGEGIDAINGGSVTIHQSAIIRTRTSGVATYSSPSMLKITDSLIEDTLANASGDYGNAFYAYLGGAFQAEDVGVTGTISAALFLYDSGACSAKTTIIEKTGGAAYSMGVDASRDQSTGHYVDFTGAGLAIVGNKGYGIGVFNNGIVAISGSLISGNVVDDVGDDEADGIRVMSGASAQITDTTLTDNEGFGLNAQGAGTTVDIKGSLFQGNVEVPSGKYDAGAGIGIQHQAVATISHVASIGNAIDGIQIFDKANAKIDHVLVSGTLATKIFHPGADGTGIYAFGALYTLDSALVEHSVTTGVANIQTGAALTNVVIDGVEVGLLPVLDGVSPAIAGVGDGVLVARGGTGKTVMSHVWISGIARAGVLFANSPGSIDTTHAEGGQYGLASQGSPKPTVGTDNEFAGTTAAMLSTGVLQAP